MTKKMTQKEVVILVSIVLVWLACLAIYFVRVSHHRLPWEHEASKKVQVIGRPSH